MLLSFEKFGKVDLTRCHIVNAVQHQFIHPHFNKVADKWRQKGVLFEFYEDTRENSKYISSIRPHILKKHWEKYEWMKDEYIFYHDCDIALTKPLDFSDKFNDDCHLSDTASYIGHKYIESKGHDLDKKMCEIAKIPLSVIENRESEAGGAQYMIRPGLDANYWQYVYDTSEQLFIEISAECNAIKKQDPNWHALQIWCADMWAVLWGLWKKGWKTPCIKEWDFSWGISSIEEWNQKAIFHNAGVTGLMHQEMIDKNEWDKYFFKSIWMKELPIASWTPNERWASNPYYRLIVQSTEETLGIYDKIKQPTISIAIPTFRRPELLQEAIKSVLDQGPSDIEIVVVNDDNEIEYTSSHPQIKVYNIEKCHDFRKKLEFTLKTAQAPYVYRLDDDDLLTPDSLQQLKEAIYLTPDANIIKSTHHWRIDMWDSSKNGVVAHAPNTGNLYKRLWLEEIRWHKMPQNLEGTRWLNEQTAVQLIGFKTLMKRRGAKYQLHQKHESDAQIRRRTREVYGDRTQIELEPKSSTQWWKQRRNHALPTNEQ